MFYVLFLGMLARAAIENLDCDLVLNPAYQIVPGTTTRVARDEIVVRGRLEANRFLSPKPQVRFGVRDVDGYDRVFAQPGDSLHYLEPGDRVFLINPNGKLFLFGYYNEKSKSVMVDWTGEFLEFDLPQPRLFEDRELTSPRLTSDRFIELFSEGAAAVLIKRIDDETRERLKARLIPQVDLYLKHQANPARFRDLAPNRAPYEMRVFETLVEGRLKDHYPNFLAPNKRHVYAMSLRLEGGPKPIPVRAGDQLFLLDEKGQLLFEYEVTEHPIVMRMPETNETTLSLLQTLGREARTILIRKVGR